MVLSNFLLPKGYFQLLVLHLSFAVPGYDGWYEWQLGWWWWLTIRPSAQIFSNGNNDGMPVLFDFDGDGTNNYDVDISGCLGQRWWQQQWRWRQWFKQQCFRWRQLTIIPMAVMMATLLILMAMMPTIMILILVAVYDSDDNDDNDNGEDEVNDTDEMLWWWERTFLRQFESIVVNP